MENRRKLTIYLTKMLNNWLIMITKKPNAIVITVRDKKLNKSKSKTVYAATLEEVCKALEEKIGKFEE